MSRTLAVVVAHPDDDTFGCSGTVALHAGDPSFRFVLVHATRGEAGQIAEESGATRETLGAVREEEDRRSWIALGREPDRHEWLGYPDGGVAEAPFDELVDRIAAILAEERPDVVITFGPEGVTAHTDHIAVGKAATDAFHRCRAADPGAFRRLLHQAIRNSAIDRWNRRLIAQGKDPIDPTKLYNPRGVPDETIGVDVDCSAVVDRTLAALREHRTQASDVDAFGEEDLGEAFEHETHVIAWPERDVGGPPLGDVFAGLV